MKRVQVGRYQRRGFTFTLGRMNRIDRLTGIILMLQGHRGITADQIAAHWEISVRTVYRDLAALTEAGVPVQSQVTGGYRLMDGYHVPPVMFTPDEASALFVSAAVTDQVADPSLQKSLGAALLKIRSVLTEERRQYLARLKQSIAVYLTPSGQRPTAGDFVLFQDAILRRHCVAIDYDTAGRGLVVTRTVEPLGLTYYANRWHLIAFCRLRQDFRDFRLDRIRRARVSHERFAGHSDFDLESFFQTQIDQGELVPVVLVVETRALERFVRELPGTPTSTVELPDGRNRVAMLAWHLEWISAWLLGFGTAIEVESPSELRHMLQQVAHGVARLYPEHEGLTPD